MVKFVSFIGYIVFLVYKKTVQFSGMSDIARLSVAIYKFYKNDKTKNVIKCIYLQ